MNEEEEGEEGEEGERIEEGREGRRGLGERVGEGARFEGTVAKIQ